jgi:hypothetical protein
LAGKEDAERGKLPAKACWSSLWWLNLWIGEAQASDALIVEDYEIMP